MKLTDLAVRKLQHDGTQKTHYDEALPNFGIRVGKHRKTWTVLVGPNRKRVTLGRYPGTSLKEARAAAAIALTLTQSTSATTPSFDEALEAYCRQYLLPNTKPSSARTAERVLRRHFGHLGPSKLTDIAPRDIFTVIDGLSKTPAGANSAFQVMRAFLNWAVSKQLIERNPVEKAKKPFRKSERDRVLTDGELARVLRATKDDSHFSRIVQLLIYTAQRRTEIGALRWEYINEKDMTITWPKEATKASRQHVLPFTDKVRQILSSIPRTSPFLFPSLNPKAPFSQWSIAMRRLRSVCEIPVHFQLHDFRRTAATNLARCGTPPHIVERILNHTAGEIRGVAAVYNRWAYLEEMRGALQKYDEFISGILAVPAVAQNSCETEKSLYAITPHSIASPTFAQRNQPRDKPESME